MVIHFSNINEAEADLKAHGFRKITGTRWIKTVFVADILYVAAIHPSVRVVYRDRRAA